jgi:hypothetical protein
MLTGATDTLVRWQLCHLLTGAIERDRGNPPSHVDRGNRQQIAGEAAAEYPHPLRGATESGGNSTLDSKTAKHA